MIKTNSTLTKPHLQLHHEADKHVFGEFRTPGLLGRHPLIGLAMVLLGGGLFLVLAANYKTNPALIELDSQILNNVHLIALQSSPIVLDIMKFGFYLAQYGFIIFGALLVLYFLYKRFWTELSMVLIAWVGEAPLWYLTSAYFDRHRPTFQISVWRQMTAPSFPSGHSLSAVMCFGLLAYLVLPKISSPFWKAVVILLTLAAIIYAGYSRIFVGDHFPTDVIAGYGLGLAWSGLVYTIIEMIALRRNKHKAA